MRSFDNKFSISHQIPSFSNDSIVTVVSLFRNCVGSPRLTAFMDLTGQTAQAGHCSIPSQDKNPGRSDDTMENIKYYKITMI